MRKSTFLFLFLFVLKNAEEEVQKSFYSSSVDQYFRSSELQSFNFNSFIRPKRGHTVFSEGLINIASRTRKCKNSKSKY